MGALQEKPGGGAHVLGTLKDMYRTAVETGVFLHRGPVGDHKGESPLPGISREQRDFIRRPCLLGNAEKCIRRLSNWATLSVRALLGNLEGHSFSRALRDSNIWAPFSRTQRMLGVLNLEAIWKFSKGTGLPWLGIRAWGIKGLSNGLSALELKGLKPNYYSTLQQTDTTVTGAFRHYASVPKNCI